MKKYSRHFGCTCSRLTTGGLTVQLKWPMKESTKREEVQPAFWLYLFTLDDGRTHRPVEVADEGVEPSPTGCKPVTLPLRQSALISASAATSPRCQDCCRFSFAPRL